MHYLRNKKDITSDAWGLPNALKAAFSLSTLVRRSSNPHHPFF